MMKCDIVYASTMRLQRHVAKAGAIGRKGEKGVANIDQRVLELTTQNAERDRYRVGGGELRTTHVLMLFRMTKQAITTLDSIRRQLAKYSATGDRSSN
jgi:hypothetical protein